jgi:hypothetical protein
MVSIYEERFQILIIDKNQLNKKQIELLNKLEYSELIDFYNYRFNKNTIFRGFTKEQLIEECSRHKN